jgi:hypothetical protein
VSADRNAAPSGNVGGRQLDLDTESELAYWLKYFDTTRDELLAAVSAVGTRANDVRTYLTAKKAGKAPR